MTTAQIAVAGHAEATVGTGALVNSVLPGPTARRRGRSSIRWPRPRRGFRVMEREFFETARPSSLIKRLRRRTRSRP